METIEILDVTAIEPKLKHPTIFQKFDALNGGEAFVIHNDHDPKPLYYQLLGERGNIFTWKYIEEGPEYWKVKIEKLTTGEKSPSIGEIVAKDHRKAEVFKKYNLDFCCGGKKTLEKACQEKGLDITEVQNALNAAGEQSISSAHNFANWDISFLADYILNTHHKYVKEAIPAIYEYTQKVAKVHGEKHPETIEVLNHFITIANELEQHMHKEEMILFPYIKQLAEAKKNGTTLEVSHFGSIQNPINMMEQEHEMVGNELSAVAELTGKYIPPADACTTYRLSYAKLREFEEDLHQHIHLENNILFPKAIEAEKELLK